MLWISMQVVYDLYFFHNKSPIMNSNNRIAKLFMGMDGPKLECNIFNKLYLNYLKCRHKAMEIQGFKPEIGSHVQQWRFKFDEPKL